MNSKDTAMCDKMFSMDNFGTWLLNELESRGLSQSELARMAGLARGTLSNLINGTRGRGPDSIEAIARALKLPPELVFREAGLLPSKPSRDDETEELNYLIEQLPPDKKPIARSILKALLEGPPQVPAPAAKRSTAKGKA